MSLPPAAVEPAEILSPYIDALREKKTENLKILDLRALTSLTDFFIIASGRSHRQVTAMAEHLKETLKKNGQPLLGSEGLKEGHWALMDYGEVIIHLFLTEIRDFYDLEGLWADAPRIAPDTLQPITRTRPEELSDDN